MALGNSKAASGKEAIFVDLKFAPNKGEEFVGFRQTVEKIPRPDAKEGERKYDYKYQTYNFVEGEIVNFRVKEEPRYDNPNEKELMGYVTVRDLGEQPDVVVKFPLLGQAGRKLVGLVAAAVEANAGSVHIYTNYAEAGTKLGDKVLDKPQAFINAKLGDAKGEKLTPLYYGEDGKPLLKEDGKPAPLPMGEKHVIARKEVWDFTAADNIVGQTALVLVEHFKRDGEAHTHADSEGEEAVSVDDDELDLQEAASAAMR